MLLRKSYLNTNLVTVQAEGEDQNSNGEIRLKKTSRNLVSEIGEETQKIEALGSLFYVRLQETTICNGHLNK